MYYPWAVSFVMHHYHTTLTRNWVVGLMMVSPTPSDKNLVSDVLPIVLLGAKIC